MRCSTTMILSPSDEAKHMKSQPASLCCSHRSRRVFLADCGLGFTGLVLGSLFAKDGAANASGAWAPPDGKPHFAPKAKRVIWMFMLGGVSHIESFDPKPGLTAYAGKKVSESPFRDALQAQFAKDNVRGNLAQHPIDLSIYPMQCGSKKFGQSGIEIADWFPHIGR